MRLDAGGPPPELFLMLRSLLAERFRLVARTETREMPVYALVLVRKDRPLGPTITPSSIDCAALAAAALANPAAPPTTPRAGRPPKCGLFGVPGRIEGWSATLTELAQMLTPLMGRVVVNHTGVAERFDFTVTFAPSQVPQDGSPVPVSPPADADVSLVTALQEQLGLRLQSTRERVEVLVVDTVSRPTPD